MSSFSRSSARAERQYLVTAFNHLIRLGVLASLAACSTVRDTQPARTATEELLISKAADKVAEQLEVPWQGAPKVFVDAQFLDGLDTKYTLSLVRDRLAHGGAKLVTDRGTADYVVEVRSGAQSINTDSTLVGIPAFPVPIPLAGTVDFPEIALYKHAVETGVSKVGMTVYAKDGSYTETVGPTFGESAENQWKVLFISWQHEDFMPPEEKK
jgi:hypothetical protein